MAPIVNIRNVYNNILNKGFVKNKFIPDNPGDIAATIALISTTTKDAVNCYYYVTQSLNNKKIPEEKRKFVAGLDLANGILNVGFQLGLGSIVNKYSDKMFEKSCGKLFDSKAAQATHKKLQQQGKNYTLEEVQGMMGKNKKWAKGGFRVIVVLLATQVFVKRVVVPFLATPLAGVFKNRLEKMEAKKTGKPCEAKNNSNDDKKVKEDDKNREAKTATTSKNAFIDLANKPVKFTKNA